MEESMEHGEEGGEEEEPTAYTGLSLAQLNRILLLRSEGKSIPDIAEATKLSESSVGKLLRHISKDVISRLKTGERKEAKGKRTRPILEVGAFNPEEFRSDLYSILRENLRFNAWWNSLPHDLKSMLVAPTQEKGDATPPIVMGREKKDPLETLKEIQMIRAFSQSGTKQDVDIIGMLDALAKREVERFKEQQALVDEAIDRRESMEQKIAERVRQSVKGKKGTFEQLGEFVDKGEKTFRKVADAFGKALGEGLAKQSKKPPPPPSVTPEEYEQMQLEKVKGVPVEIPAVDESQTFGGAETISVEEASLPPEPELEGEPPTEEPTEKPEKGAGGGSLKEIQRRKKRSKRK